MMRAITKGLRAFGIFWWEFLIGENPDGFVGTLVIVGAALALRHDGWLGVVVVPVLVVVVLVVSTYRGHSRTNN